MARVGTILVRSRQAYRNHQCRSLACREPHVHRFVCSPLCMFDTPSARRMAQHRVWCEAFGRFMVNVREYTDAEP